MYKIITNISLVSGFSLAIFYFNDYFTNYYHSGGYDVNKGYNQWMKIFAIYRVLDWTFVIVIYVCTIVAPRLCLKQEFGKKLSILDQLESYFRDH